MKVRDFFLGRQDWNPCCTALLDYVKFRGKRDNKKKFCHTSSDISRLIGGVL